ncbi:hypothetical protein [Pseudomonas sp. BN414]|uniref:hypothetical protein n=1 Tax=Pseudomonas sp. BN414 TaxID=2567888 RepID=UPI0024583F84|nr:hypothetical protein [Pseudomonas sp. BN414]
MGTLDWTSLFTDEVRFKNPASCPPIGGVEHVGERQKSGRHAAGEEQETDL